MKTVRKYEINRAPLENIPLYGNIWLRRNIWHNVTSFAEKILGFNTKVIPRLYTIPYDFLGVLEESEVRIGESKSSQDKWDGPEERRRSHANQDGREI